MIVSEEEFYRLMSESKEIYFYKKPGVLIKDGKWYATDDDEILYEIKQIEHPPLPEQKVCESEEDALNEIRTKITALLQFINPYNKN